MQSVILRPLFPPPITLSLTHTHIHTVKTGIAKVAILIGFVCVCSWVSCKCVWSHAWVLRISVEASGTVLCQYYLSGCWMNVLRALSSNYALERKREGRTWRGLPHADHFSPSFHVFLRLFSLGFVPVGFFFCPSVPPNRSLRLFCCWKYTK